MKKLFKKLRRKVFGMRSTYLKPLQLNTERNSHTFLVDKETFVKVQDNEIQAIITLKYLPHRLVFETTCEDSFGCTQTYTVERKVHQHSSLDFIRDSNGGCTLSTKFQWKRGDVDAWEIFGWKKGTGIMHHLHKSDMGSFKGYVALFEEVK